MHRGHDAVPERVRAGRGCPQCNGSGYSGRLGVYEMFEMTEPLAEMLARMDSAAFAAGARGVTHLFNAMSQLGHRTPGVVGAALDNPAVASGLIADGIHVHPATARIALAATGNGPRLFLVSDSMSQAGTDITQFTLHGDTIYRKNGALRLADGTLAGADLTIDRAMFTAQSFGVPFEQALRMASSYPAVALGAPDRVRLTQGQRADFVHLVDGRVAGTWIGGSGVSG